MNWAFLHVVFVVFVDILFQGILSFIVPPLHILGFGLLADFISDFIFWFVPVMRWTILGINLFLTNSVYEGFHPTLAPGLSDSESGYIPSLLGLFMA